MSKKTKNDNIITNAELAWGVIDYVYQNLDLSSLSKGVTLLLHKDLDGNVFMTLFEKNDPVPLKKRWFKFLDCFRNN